MYRSVNGRHGRGLITAVKLHLITAVVTIEASNPDTNLLIVNIKLGKKSLYLINLYIPRQAPLENYEQIFEEIEQICGTSSLIVIAGDVNIPELFNCAHNNCNFTSQYQIFTYFLELNALTQHNTILNGKSRILVVLTSLDIKCPVQRMINTIVQEDSHHPGLIVTLSLEDMPKIENFRGNHDIYRYNFRRADLFQLYSAISQKSWNTLQCKTDVNKVAEALNKELYDLLDLYVPKSEVRISKYPIWFSANIIKKLKLKRSYWKQYKKKTN